MVVWVEGLAVNSSSVCNCCGSFDCHDDGCDGDFENG